MSETVRVAKAAGIVGSATLASRIMGYVRDMVMSWAYGTSAAADAFYVAYRIPNLLRELLAEGSMSAAFIPVFTETLAKEGKEQARRLANAVFARLLIILIVLTVLGIIFAPEIVRTIAWGWKGGAQQDLFRTAVLLTRVMFPYLLFIGLAALAMGMLNSLRSFLTPALSPVMLNIFTISGVVLLAPRMPQPILGAAVGVMLGGLFQFLIQLPGLRKQGMMLRPQFTPSYAGVGRIGRLAAPIFISSSAIQLNIFIGTILASFLATGSITYLFYAMRFIHFPLGIFGVAIATAMLPTLSTHAAKQEVDEFRVTLSLGLRLVFFVMFPAMAGLITLAVPIVNLLLERGAFDRISTLGTASALVYYAFGLWAFAGARVVTQAFYSLQDTKTPVKIAFLGVVMNIILSIALAFWTPLAHGGLALATSLSAMVSVVLLIRKLRKKMGRMDGRRVFLSLAKTVPASAGMGIIGWWISSLPLWDLPGNMLRKTQYLAGGIAASVVFYLIVMWMLRSEELKFLLGAVRRKRRRTAGGAA